MIIPLINILLVIFWKGNIENIINIQIAAIFNLIPPYLNVFNSENTSYLVIIIKIIKK